ncbi:DUF1566 domain-containing protein [Marinobacter daepoensis]|uniref:Lcl C-terminal domain-containing protein n=1 Tax=Marinobacter daepoensis TaxID=262077 RepID=UPI001C96D101|nr:DUF1566 domain-containing protein [Marinobacter daepoensis]MBY6032155.1 DUF1566 domain-containing protein [Marinobacter daepoensis]
MPRFIDNSDNTITDTKTGLVWTKSNVAKDVDHEAAEKAVADLDGSWRLPAIEELRELIDYTKRQPAIDTDAFPDTESDWYWTSTPVAGYEDAARWVVDFGDGYVYGLNRYDYACVRAVRAGQ